MDLSCLHLAWISTSDLLMDFGGDEWAGLYLVAFLMAVVLAPLVLWRYQKRVVQLMAVSGTSPASNATDEGISTNKADLPPEHSHMQSEWSAVAFIEESKKRSIALQRTLALSVGIFAMVVALMLTVSPDSISEDAATSAAEWMANAVLYQLFVASLCLPLVLLSHPRATFQRLFVRLCAPLYIFTVALAIGFDDATGIEEKLLDFTVAVFLLLVLYAGIGGRSARNVVPLVTLLLCLMWPVIVLVSAGMNLADACLGGVENGYFLLAGLLLVVGLIWLIARIPFGVLSLLTRAYERQAFSDAQFQMGAWLILIALFFAFAAGPDEYGLNRWSLGVLVAALLGLGMYRYRLAAIKPWQPTRIR